MLNVSSNVAEVLSWTDRLSDQYEFAVASALTATAKAAAADLPAEVDAAVEGGAVPFTRQGFYITAARKKALTATVGIKRQQAKYLRWLVEGGERQPNRTALRLPSVVQLTSQGNLPAGTIARLVQRAKAGKRATKAQAKRFGVSTQLDLFYGDPQDDRPPGIYKRVDLGQGRHQLVPVVVFPKQSATYRARWDFGRAVQTRVLATFEANLRRAWDRAKETAK